MDGDKCLKRLDLVGEHRLSGETRKKSILADTLINSCYEIVLAIADSTYTFIPAQKAADDL